MAWKVFKEIRFIDSNISLWFAEFKLGCPNTNDTKCSGRPNEAFTSKNIKKIPEMFWTIIRSK